ncbi:MAG: hypothetical protein HC802_05265 [Caldilineaceae bacterium]|nr:hypothetical protein [Caldilineaceae bacterium]
MATPHSAPDVPLRVAIFGIGAMGTLFASRLSAVAHVALIGNWSAQIEAVQRCGLLLTELDGTQRRVQLTITRHVQDVEMADVALILVKSYQTAGVASLARQVLRSTGVAVTCRTDWATSKRWPKILAASERHLA